MTASRTSDVRWERAFAALCVLALAEWLLSPLWHDDLLSATYAACDFWSSQDVATAPMHLWRRLLIAIGFQVDEPDSFLGGLIALVIGMPLLVIGSLLLEVIWLGPYLAGLLLTNLASAAAKYHILAPGAAAVVWWKASPAFRRWICASTEFRVEVHRPVVTPVPNVRATAAPPIPAPTTSPRVHAAPRLVVMGPEHLPLYGGRIDPFTRTRFVLGEQFVLCGGSCGRAYKLVTCEHLQYRCPVDQAPLR
jgi:hypothetical protein